MLKKNKGNKENNVIQETEDIKANNFTDDINYNLCIKAFADPPDRFNYLMKLVSCGKLVIFQAFYNLNEAVIELNLTFEIDKINNTGNSHGII